MSAEADATMNTLLGRRAFTTSYGYWIWEGDYGAYYDLEGGFRNISVLRLIDINERDWAEVDVPSWFHGHP